MLAFLTTDADVAQGELQRVLKEVVDRTFNTLNVDGATSTQ
jgi:glutamate N-acetyltransferase/amino-acid N-acetyltransferase